MPRREVNGRHPVVDGTAKLTNIVPLLSPNFPKTVILSFALKSIPTGKRERESANKRREIKVAANEVARNFDLPANN